MLLCGISESLKGWIWEHRRLYVKRRRRLKDEKNRLSHAIVTLTSFFVE